jgi:hypothetical protein
MKNLEQKLLQLGYRLVRSQQDTQGTWQRKKQVKKQCGLPRDQYCNESLVICLRPELRDLRPGEISLLCKRCHKRCYALIQDASRLLGS